MKKNKLKKNAKKRWKRKITSHLFFIALFCFGLNILVGVFKSPGNLLAPLASVYKKNPNTTWQAYSDYFEMYSSPLISSQFLAALAQVESSGNPLASTYWKWNFNSNIFQIFQPASSAFGIYQITSPTLKEVSKFCWKGEQWTKDSSKGRTKCWENYLRFRISAHDSIHMVSARLNYYVERFKQNFRLKLNRRKAEKIAAAIHLCGKDRVYRALKQTRGISKIHRCGAHRLSNYVRKIRSYQSNFTTLASN